MNNTEYSTVILDTFYCGNKRGWRLNLLILGQEKENKSRDQQYAGCHSVVGISIRLLDTAQWNWLISCKLFDTNTTLYKAHNCRGLENWGEPNCPLHLRKWPAFFDPPSRRQREVTAVVNKVLPLTWNMACFFYGVLHKVKVDRVNGSCQPLSRTGTRGLIQYLGYLLGSFGALPNKAASIGYW